MTKAYVVCDIRVTDPERYDAYKQLSAPAVAAHGGRFVVRGGPVEVLEGDVTPGRVVVLEFDSVETARRWYESAEYRVARAVREGAATASFVLVPGADT
jgi:uncharacterized protein (DUF1330 family)